MVRIDGMADHIFRPDRRALLAGLGAVVLNPAAAAPALAQGRPAVTLQAKADILALRPGEPDTPIWSLAGSDLRFGRGDSPEIAFGNDLPSPMILNWRGIDGASAAEAPSIPRQLRTIELDRSFPNAISGLSPRRNRRSEPVSDQIGVSGSPGRRARISALA